MSEQEFIGNTSQADLDEKGKCKLHHYVPIWLQKGFADDDGLLWTADKNHGELKHIEPQEAVRRDTVESSSRSGHERWATAGDA